MIPESLKTQGPILKWSLTLFLILGFCFLAGPALAGEGGVTHVIPGATATFADLPPTSPGWFLKPMVLNYKGSFSAQLPTAAGLAGNMDVTVNTVALVGGYTFGQTFLGGAHYSIAAALPYSWVDISANVQKGARTVRLQNNVSGLGDLTVLPVMLAWKFDDWQIDATLPIYSRRAATKRAGWVIRGLTTGRSIPRSARSTATRRPASTPCSMPVIR